MPKKPVPKKLPAARILAKFEAEAQQALLEAECANATCTFCRKGLKGQLKTVTQLSMSLLHKGTQQTHFQWICKPCMKDPDKGGTLAPLIKMFEQLLQVVALDNGAASKAPTRKKGR